MLLALMAVLLSVSGSTHPLTLSGDSDASVMEKIRFDLSVLDDDGLYGPPDGRRALHYEFCIPATETHADQVRAIDPTIQVMRGSRGRIGCTADQFLCIGSTHQADFRGVLNRLAELPYIDRIEQSFAE